MVSEILADRYEIIDVIGEGGMGVVYKARHVLMKRVVAIKMLHESLIANEVTRKRFEQEAQAISALNHPNILTVYDFGITQDNKPYLVVEFLEGTNLSDLLESETYLPEQRALHIFGQACSGLAHAHDKGIIHRDIKPSNFMLIKMGTDEDFVKIVDFGIAKLVQEGQKETIGLTSTGEIFGSPLYMSPEQCCGKPVDARSDVYSLGCVMYCTLTGRSPFAAENVPECLYKHVHQQPVAFAEANPEISLSPTLEAVVFKAMEKEAENRYPSMNDFAQALEAYEGGSTSLKELLAEAKVQTQPAVAASDAAATQPPSGLAASSSSIPAVSPVNSDTPIASPTVASAPTASQPAKSTVATHLHIPVPAAAAAAVVVLGLLGVLVWKLFPYNHNSAQLYAEYKQQAKVSFDKADYSDADRLYTLAYHEAERLPNSASLLDATADQLYSTYLKEGKYDKLGILAIKQRDFPKAIALLNSELEKIQAKSGKGSPQTASILSPLAKMYELQGDYNKAEQLYAQALTIKKGAHQSTTTQSDSSLAQLLQKRYSNVKQIRADARRRQTTARRSKEVKPTSIPTKAHPEQAMLDNAAQTIPAETISTSEQSAEDKPKKRGVLGSVGHGIKKVFGIFGHHKEKSEEAP